MARKVAIKGTSFEETGERKVAIKGLSFEETTSVTTFEVPLIIPKKYHPDFVDPRKKPVGPVVVDPTNSLGRSIDFGLFLGDSYRELATGRLLDVTADTTTPAVSSVGRVIQTRGPNNDDHITFESPWGNSNVQDDFSHSISLLVKPDVASGYKGIFQLGGGQGFGGIYCYANGSDWEYITGEWPNEIAVLSNSVRTGEWQWVTGVHDAEAGTIQIYVDGVEGTSDVDGAIGESSTTVYIGNCFVPNFDTQFDGQLACFFHHNKALSYQEVRELHQNPWQVLKPAIPFLYYTPAAAGSGLSIPIAAYHYNHSLKK